MGIFRLKLKYYTAIDNSKLNTITNIMLGYPESDVYDDGSDWSLYEECGEDVANVFAKEPSYIIQLNNKYKIDISLINHWNATNIIPEEEAALVKSVFAWMNDYVKNNYLRVQERSTSLTSTVFYSEKENKVTFKSSNVLYILLPVRVLVKEFLNQYGKSIPTESIFEFIDPITWFRSIKTKSTDADGAIKEFTKKYGSLKFNEKYHTK